MVPIIFPILFPISSGELKLRVFFVKDIYIAAVFSAHSVCSQGYFVAIVSTLVETDKPEREVSYYLYYF